ncbi:olfactory receptor 1F1-like [Ambystoma mexicanum]|uniref:olfactory receptor 1F1-like n=1 Tax=Ambystoma mexicanum TaxID=8296 RepID=UPI0037E70512
MTSVNQTLVTDFILLGFSDLPRYQIHLFAVFLVIFIITLMGNLTIILSVTGDPRLHCPMYFFLANLSFVDICLGLVTLPQMLVHFFLERKSITYGGCLAQVFFFLLFANVEDFLLTVMAYDRYVAICNPLHYPVVMRKTACAQMVAGTWVTAILHSILHTGMTSRLSFCGASEINHFLCDVVPLFKLSCSDTFPNQMVIFTEGSLVVMSPFLIIVISYICIIRAILKIPSALGRRKTFSTCSSHLAVVIPYFGTIMFMYFRPATSFALTKDREASVMYTILAPMLNPFIYSLRNNEVKGAIMKVILGKIISSNS